MKRKMRSGLATMLVAGLVIGLPVPGADLSAKTAVKKPVVKKPVRRVPPPPPMVKPPMRVRVDPETPPSPPVPLRLPKGSPAILVSPPARYPMGLAPPPPPIPAGKAGPQIKELGTLQFAPTVADVQAAGWTGTENEDADLMLTIRSDGRVEECKKIEFSSSFSTAMCALIMKSARFQWTGEGDPPSYGYLFVSTQWDISPDIDAKLDLMPEDQGLPVDIMLRRGSYNDGCNVLIRGMSADQERSLCAKVKHTLASYGGKGTNGVAFDPDDSDVSVWLRRRPAGEEPTLAVKWNTYWRAGFPGPK
jgi:hypothetical protein